MLEFDNNDRALDTALQAIPYLCENKIADMDGNIITEIDDYQNDFNCPSVKCFV